MWLFDGLPLHPLLVHAPVVLIPLVASGLVVWIVWPASRPVLAPVLAGLAIGAAITAILAVETGEQLAEALQRGDAVETHEERGELTRFTAVLLALATSALAAVTWFRPDSRIGRSVLPAIPVAVLGVGATVAVAVTGHSGSTLAWEEKVAAATGVAGAAADGAAGGGDGAATPTAAPEQSTSTPTGGPSTSPPGAAPASPTPAASPAEIEELVDVVLGEWTIVMSVEEAPPGPTRFRVRNAGTRTHAFRIRTPGSGGERQEWRTEPIDPGETVEVEWDLPTGELEVDCPVEDDAGEHDGLGMEAVLSVREDAPPVRSAAPPAETATPGDAGAGDDAAASDAAGGEAAPAPTAPAGGGEPASVEIRAFEFAPVEVTVTAGSEVTWTNADPTAHTATGDGFDTGSLANGASASATFDTPGRFAYVCSIHPSMEGTVVVTG